MQMTSSPPCIMVRAMFAFAEVPLELVEISILTKSEISWSKYQKVPIVTLNGLQVMTCCLCSMARRGCLHACADDARIFLPGQRLLHHL